MSAAATQPIDRVPPKATRREWIGLAVIALPCLVYAMDLTVLNLALPAISAEFRPTSSQLLWIIDIYGFMVAGFLITMGTLGDRIGRRKLLLLGAAAFAAASTIAAFSSSADMLVAMRALLGVAGATLAPSTLSLIRNMFHNEHERQLAIGVWIASYSVGGAIGPLVGGVLLEYFWWGSVFLIAVPVMILLLLLGPTLLPEYRDPNAGQVDLASVAQSLASVLGIVYALKQFAERGFGWGPALLLAAGLAVGALFVRRQSRLAYPLLDTTLFRQAKFSAGIAAYGLSSLAMFGIYIFIAQYLQLVLGLTPLQAGVATLPWGLAFVAGSLVTPRLARRWSPVSILVWGLVTSALGFALLALVDGPYAIAVLVISTVIMSAGMAPVFTVGNEMIITAAPPERAGAASALSETSSELSGALGIAVFGSLGMVVYRSTLGDALPTSISPTTAADAMATLGGAMAAASTLPKHLGDLVRASAGDAFTTALQINTLVGSAVIVTASIVAARILRDADSLATAGAK